MYIYIYKRLAVRPFMWPSIVATMSLLFAALCYESKSCIALTSKSQQRIQIVCRNHTVDHAIERDAKKSDVERSVQDMEKDQKNWNDHGKTMP